MDVTYINPPVMTNITMKQIPIANLHDVCHDDVYFIYEIYMYNYTIMYFPSYHQSINMTYSKW